MFMFQFLAGAEPGLPEAPGAAAPMEIWEGTERKKREGRKKNGDIEKKEGAQSLSNKFLYSPLSTNIACLSNPFSYTNNM
jgi:hypothetical protein